MKFLGIEKSPVIVAEISGNHHGDIDKAYELIWQAKNCGADAVKIQCYTADEMVIDKSYIIQGSKWNGRNLYELYKKNETPREWIPKLFDCARRYNIPIFSSVFSRKGIEFLEELNCPAYKISGFESNDIGLVKAAYYTEKPVLVSINQFTPASTIARLSYISRSIIPLHCISNYPTKRTDANLGKISALKTLYDNVGYSDHNESMLTAAFASVLGACIIERHMELNFNEGDDKEFSLSPAQFRIYVRHIRMAMECVNVHDPENQGTEQFMRTLYASREIKEGEPFLDSNTITARPYAVGNLIEQWPLVKSRYAACDIPENTPLNWSYTDDTGKGL